VENLDSELNRALSSDTRVVILRMKRLRAAGSSAMAILAHYFDLLEKRGISLVVSGIDKSLSDLLSRSGLRDKIGEQNIFYADNTLFQSTELAVARARGVVEMERRRRELKSALTAPPPSVSIGAAREVMSRQCVRFGQGHSVREAVWLLSEMSKRLASRDVVPLFLQDVEGKLVGSVTAWDLLSEMTKSINLDEMCQKADEDLGARLISRFEVKLSSFANRQNPVVGMNSRLGRMIFEWAKSDAHILPIQDEQGRIAGMVGQSDLLDLVGGSLVSVEENSELTKPSDEMKQR
jgi:CBS domain-containing protein/ABC-type transporter Mla MlaB component